MHELINKLAFSLFKKNSLEECKLEEIEELVDQYPYFSSAQLLLAAKQKQAGDQDFQKQLATASLHVTNPFWLDHLLSSPAIEERIVEEDLDATEVNNEPNNDELVLEKNRREFVVASTQQVDTTKAPTEEIIVTPGPAAHALVIEEQDDAHVTAEQLVQTPVVEKQDNVQMSAESQAPPPPAEKEDEIHVNAETATSPLATEKKEIAAEGKLVFEPYYTVDYFASQGIKNVVEEKPKDRFSQQLRSFTEWLKAIRQMPPQQIAALSDSKAEEKVVQLATHSLDEENVETEAMAEVWIKQGHPEKAVRIYEKLSLLNPPKSSYFASLIENLKKT
jgi:hypothetical protein